MLATSLKNKFLLIILHTLYLFKYLPKMREMKAIFFGIHDFCLQIWHAVFAAIPIGLVAMITNLVLS